MESAEPTFAGPVKAGRIDATVQQFAGTLSSALVPVVQASREISAGLRAVRPDELTVEFGVKLTARAGAILASGDGTCHLKVVLSWSRGAVGGLSAEPTQ
ncbi:CU044_2847 family protein [Paractinoplanes ferrugineus]|uniref:Trypsin-co-occurring domain-containing protein n=1 Tax=Paractinoplanes ferrugineus TaxID=113564 RepID=A0A919MK89_9ACTN|nr:hypothetical protein Afe05nite_73500 [Actinoplanes ferrugineus]